MESSLYNVAFFEIFGDVDGNAVVRIRNRQLTMLFKFKSKQDSKSKKSEETK